MKKIYTRIIRFLLVFGAIILLYSCASQKFAKLALKNEQAGLYEDAAELYMKSLHANPNNIEAKIGVKKNGQITLDKKISEFSKAYSSGQNQNAVYYYLNAKKYYDYFSRNRIDLEFPPSYEEQYNEVKQAHVEEKYKQGAKLLNEEKYYESESIFNEILSLEPNYKDVRELFKTAHYEPFYRDGKKYFDNKLYRKSYNAFNTIITEINEYKEAVQLRQDALSAAIFTIWIKDFEYVSNANIASTLRGLILAQLNNYGKPFIKIVDKSNSQEIINEQQLGLTGTVDKSTSAQAGKLLGTKAILTAKVGNINVYNGALQNKRTKGYLQQQTQTTNSSTNQTTYSVSYKKIDFYEYNQTNTVSCSFKYQLISTESGTVLVSDEIVLTNSDEIHYALYDGNFKNIYPGYWKWLLLSNSEDNINTNYNDVSNLQSLFTARKNLKSIDILAQELFESIATKASQNIINYNPEN